MFQNNLINKWLTYHKVHRILHIVYYIKFKTILISQYIFIIVLERSHCTINIKVYWPKQIHVYIAKLQKKYLSTLGVRNSSILPTNNIRFGGNIPT